ncbi:hypothetical protein A2U01_0062028, partial [Trifolium medium]|nr:hypothetical protein [Trifolium medium]
SFPSPYRSSHAYGTLVISSTLVKSIPEYTCSYQFTVLNFSVEPCFPTPSLLPRYFATNNPKF